MIELKRPVALVVLDILWIVVKSFPLVADFGIIYGGDL